ncbi:MAG: ribosome silencing factor [Pseudomonadota bacterium]
MTRISRKDGLIPTRRKALLVAETAQDHKALNLRILNVTRHCDYADYFFLMSATSTRHAKGLADAIREAVPGPTPNAEGYTNGEWVLLDLGDVVVHIFYEPVRSYYCLDKLWGHVPTVTLAALTGRPKKRASAARARS